MSWLCTHCGKHVERGHSCIEGFRQSALYTALMSDYCDGCKHLSPTEEEQNRMSIKVSHRCVKLNKTLYHFGVHPHIVKHPNCPGKEVN